MYEVRSRPEAGRASVPPICHLGRGRVALGHLEIAIENRTFPHLPIDPIVWSGRALQVDFAAMAVSGLASMYPAFDWSDVLLAVMDISARAISLPDRPQRAIRVTSVRRRREDRTSISSHPLADLGGAGWFVASSIFRTSKARPRAKTLQAIRASLLASAIASTL
jgi:hypothetical protein